MGQYVLKEWVVGGGELDGYFAIGFLGRLLPPLYLYGEVEVVMILHLLTAESYSLPLVVAFSSNYMVSLR